jgi:hypothetical protein
MPINKSLADLLKEQEQKRISQTEGDIATTGSALWDFAGQALWGVTEQASFSTLGAYDAYLEGQYGDDAETWEDAMAGDASGDWNELTNSGKAGYMIGSALGMIPSFIVGGGIAGKAITGAARIGGIGTKVAAKKSTQELIKAAGKVPTKEGMKSASSILKGNASKIIDDAYETAVSSHALNKIEGAFAKELIENSMKDNVKRNMGTLLKGADDEMLEALADQTVKIVSRNNPADAMQMMNMLANKVPGLSGRPYAPLILGAMGYDAAIGVAMASIRNAVETGTHKTMGVLRDEMGEYTYKGNYDINWGDGFAKWGHDALHEAAFFSILGPVKFIKGGTTGQHFSRLKKVLGTAGKRYWKPLNKYKEGELKSQLTAMNELSAGRLGAGLKDNKWINKEKEWWASATGPEGVKEMQKFLGEVRSHYIKGAPKEWAREFGRDVYKSLPRMGAGIVAMNSFTLGEAFYRNGLSLHTIGTALGESGPEIAANIMTAMYFTRKPHSFHIETKPGNFPKMFETGDVKAYMDGKASKLRQIMGGLETFGMDRSKLDAISAIYSTERHFQDRSKVNSNNIMKEMDSTVEFNAIEKIFQPYVGTENVGGVPLKDAFNKNIAELVKRGEITMDEAAIMQDKLFIAEKIINEYNNNSQKPIDIELYTPEQAFEIVKQISSMKFNDKLLTPRTIDMELKDWRKKTVLKAIEEPIRILKNYMRDSYEAAGLGHLIEETAAGELLLPRLTNITESPFTDRNVATTFATVYEYGVRNNWIKPATYLPTDRRGFTGEEQAAVGRIWKEKTGQMMDHVYGDGWRESGRVVDEMILSSPTWSMSYDSALMEGQRQRAYELLTGGRDHDLNMQEASWTFETIEKLLLSKEKPEVVKPTEGKMPENYGEVSKFIDDIYGVVRDLNPDIKKERARTITFKEAEELMLKVNSQLGNVFTDPKVFELFKRDIRDRSYDRLGLVGKDASIDIIVSYDTLQKDPTFNTGEPGVIELPGTGIVRGELRKMYKNKQINLKTYKDLSRHYETIMSALSQSKVPHRVADNVRELNDGDWMKALIKSKAAGEWAVQEMSFDRASLAASFLENEIDKFDMLINQLNYGANNKDLSISEKAFESLTNVNRDRDVTANLYKIIKTALIEKNPYVLRAVARKQGDINSILETLARNPMNSTRIGYAEEVVRLAEDITTKAQLTALHESTINEFVINQMKRFGRDIPDKDIPNLHQRMTANIFSSKYKVSNYDLDRIFEINESTIKSATEIKDFVKGILGDYYEMTQDISDPTLRNTVQTIVNTLNKASGDILLSNDNFMSMIVAPLRARMELTNFEKDAVIKNALEIDQDLQQVVTNYYSKMAVKTLKINLKRNRLSLGYKSVGKTEDRGLTGIISALDPGQNSIYLAEMSGIDINNKPIRNIINRELSNYNEALMSSNFSIENPKAEMEYLRTGGSTKELKDTADMRISEQGSRFQIIPMNESTALIVRVDKHSESIHRELAVQFSENGLLYKMLEAVYDGDLGRTGPEYEAMRNFLQNVRGNRDLEGVTSVVEGIKLTRMLLNMPMEIRNVLDNGTISLDHQAIKEYWKVDKLNETKNAVIPTNDNRLKTDLMFRDSKSELFKNIHDEVKPWLVPDEKTGKFRNIKALSINDKMEFNDPNVKNVFDALERFKIELEWQRDQGLIDGKEYLYNMEQLTEGTKSIVDGDTFVTRDLYLASMGVMGLTSDMLHVNSNNQVTGFKAGGIKPTIAYSSIVTEGKGEAGSGYGRMNQWYSKTAMKYNPVIETLLRDLNIDMLTFKSANKVNKYKERIFEDVKEGYADINGVTKDQLTREYEARNNEHMPWNEFVLNNVNKNAVTEIPFEAVSLRTIAKGEHDPTVANSLFVHMSDKNGGADWIGIDGKVTRYENNLNRMFTDPYYRTALAQKVFGEMAGSGDPSMTDSAISSMLTRNGLMLEPWAQRKLEDNLIGYFINNGAIAGGRVTDGSLDVMVSDYGNLKSTIRSTIADRPVVKYYGEFLPSYWGAQKKWKTPGDEQFDGIQNVIIQRVKYRGEEYRASKDKDKEGLVESQERTADGYIIEIEKQKFLIVEGRMIGADGILRDVDTQLAVHSKPLDTASPAVRREYLETVTGNKGAFLDALKMEKEAYELTTSEYIGKKLVETKVLNHNSSLADAALAIRKLETNGVSLAVGMLNSRQPRNMIGDVVISKMAIIDGKAHLPIESGNISMMNAIDAIRPMDADFDFDKSFNFVAAPGEFWREAGKVAGYISHATEQSREVLNDLFNPNGYAGQTFSKTFPDLLGVDTQNDALIGEVNDARGLFVKMHQVTTYMKNIFRENNLVLHFTSNRLMDQNKNLQVRFNGHGKYIKTVDNIGDMAKRFIDVYKNLPSEQDVNDINRLQDLIYFGKDGIFELGYENTRSPGGFEVVKKYDLSQGDFAAARRAINMKLIDPLRRYLKYNQGIEADEQGLKHKATIEDYNAAFENLYWAQDPTNKRGLDPSINMESGLNQARMFMATSRSPYEIAMRGMHRMYDKMSSTREMGAYGKGFTESKRIIDYIENGLGDLDPTSEVAAKNKIFNRALDEYVKDESRILQLLSLRKKEQSLEIEIQTMESYTKGLSEPSKQIAKLNKELARVSELKEWMEESLSYLNTKDHLIEDYRPKTQYHQGYEYNAYKNYGAPKVILDPKGNIKEVILNGGRNRNAIGKFDTIVENGRHYKVADSEQQQGLRVLFEAFAGDPVITSSNGETRRFTETLEKGYLQDNYNLIMSEVLKVRDIFMNSDKQGEHIAKYNSRRKSVLYEMLFKNIEDPFFRKALILRMLTPHVSDRIVSLRGANEGESKKAVLDYMYSENMLNEPLMQMLSSVASGEYRREAANQGFAIEVLDQINVLKNAAYISSKNPAIDIDQLTFSMYAEPASAQGYLTDRKILNQTVFDKSRTGNEIEKQAAQVMIEYASGKLLDPVILYKASMVMEKAGIAIQDQWGMSKYTTDPDGSLRNFGTKRILINEVDAIRRKDLGDKGGYKKSTTNQVKNIVSCYR